MFRPIGAVAAFLLSAQSAFAFVYDCNVTGPSKYGWIADRMVFSVDEKAGTVAVLDAAILSVQKVPMITDLSNEYGRHVMRWKVKGLKSYRNNEPARDIGTVSYKATVFPKDNRIVVTVHLPGSDNVPRGDGVCVKKTEK